MKADAANPFDLTRRVAIVTDGGSPTGIGTATASLLAGLRAAQRVVDAAVHRWGRLDVLVSNVGDADRSRDLRLCASARSAGGWRRRAGDREKVPS